MRRRGAPSGVDGLGCWIQPSLAHSWTPSYHTSSYRESMQVGGLLVPYVLLPYTWSDTAKVLCPLQLFREAHWYPCCPRSWALRPRGSGYTGIWAPLQGPLCHFLATLKHTEVVRWGRPVKAQSCWEHGMASAERRRSAALELTFSQFCL